MFDVDDIVVITVDNPEGATNIRTKDVIGVVTGTSMHSELCYSVSWCRGSYVFLFTEEELRYATDQEIRKALLKELRPLKSNGVDAM